MTDTPYGQGLTGAIEELWRSVTELMLITVEDQPDDTAPAAVDAFAEQVSELQGDVAAVRAATTLPSSGRPAATWSTLDAVTWRYWQRIRAFEAVLPLRTATRRRGGSWPAWQQSVEQSARRCEEALCRSRAAALPYPDEPSATTLPAGHADPRSDDQSRRMP
jgi:hypothetical protein